MSSRPRPQPHALTSLLIATALAVTVPAAAPVAGLVAAPSARAALASGFATTAATPIAPGAFHESGLVTTDRGGQRVEIVAVEPYRSELSFEAALSNDRVGGLERTTSLAIRRSAEGHRVVAAINADVWSGSSSLVANAPNGIHIEGGELVTADASTRAVFGVGQDRVPRIGAVKETLTLTTADGAIHPITRLNQTPNGGIALYTPRFGPQLSTVLEGVEVVVGGVALPLRPAGAWSGVVLEMRPAGGGLPIAPDTVVLDVPPESLALLGLGVGLPVAITASITPGWESVTQAVSGRGFLVRDGALAITSRPSDARWTHPRSAIALTSSGQVLLVTVDGRDDDSRGLDLDDFAALLVARGAWQAINLDGGSSSTLAVRRPGDVNVTVANSPSAGREIGVTNGLHVVLSVPTGPLAQIAVVPSSARLYPGGGARFAAKPLDAAWNPVLLGVGELSWSVSGSVGTVDGTGRFSATAPGVAQVAATARGVTGAATVEVVPDTTPPVAAQPLAEPARGIGIERSVPVTISWAAAVETESGVASYELERSVDGGEYAAVVLPSPTATSVRLGLPRSRTYGFRLRAIDRAGNAGAWVDGGAFRLAVAQESTRALKLVRGSWPLASSPSYEGKKARTTRTKGAVATFTFTGTGVGWVAALGPGRGSALVSIDGGPPETVSLHAGVSSARRIVWSRSWSATTAHTVTISVVGTKGHPRVDLDAFVVHAPG